VREILKFINYYYCPKGKTKLLLEVIPQSNTIRKKTKKTKKKLIKPSSENRTIIRSGSLKA